MSRAAPGAGQVVLVGMSVWDRGPDGVWWRLWLWRSDSCAESEEAGRSWNRGDWHALYLHVYDPAGRQVGFNESNAYRSMLDTGIPGAMYEDFRNGTKVLLLPGGLEDFRVVVDGQHMEEDEESYALSLTVIRSGQVTSTQSLEGVIHRNTTHSTPVEIEDGTLVVGETVVEGEPEKASLPGWFTRLFPFLVPVLEPVLPYVPSGLVPFVPFLALLLPLLVVVLVVSVVLRSRRGRAKSRGSG